ncbi:MAG: oxidoreductase, partial [Betaproteobacteria bacterium]
MQTVEHFKAYRTFQEDGVIRSRFVEMAANELDPGDVLVRTKYSTIN